MMNEAYDNLRPAKPPGSYFTPIKYVPHKNGSEIVPGRDHSKNFGSFPCPANLHDDDFLLELYKRTTYYDMKEYVRTARPEDFTPVPDSHLLANAKRVHPNYDLEAIKYAHFSKSVDKAMEGKLFQKIPEFKSVNPPKGMIRNPNLNNPTDWKAPVI